MKTCTIDGCGWKHKAKGLCKKHYHQHQRGTLDTPRYSVPRPLPRGRSQTEWPYEFIKLGDDWFRRPTGSQDGWLPVVWPERDETNAGPRPRGDL